MNSFSTPGHPDSNGKSHSSKGRGKERWGWLFSELLYEARTGWVCSYIPNFVHAVSGPVLNAGDSAVTRLTHP